MTFFIIYIVSFFLGIHFLTRFFYQFLVKRIFKSKIIYFCSVFRLPHQVTVYQEEARD